MVYTNGNEIVDAYTNGVQVVEIYSNGVKVWPTTTPSPANNQIFYTSTNNAVVTPNRSNVYGANIVSNTYTNGQGVIEFDGPVTSIGLAAFDGCSTLKTVTLPGSVTSIGDEAFWNCTKMTSINIPNSVTSIGSGAFWSCEKLQSIIMPDSVTSVGDEAFSYCHDLSTLVISSSLTMIDINTFDDCSSLTSVVIPSSVTRIKYGAFDRCFSLAEVIVNNVTPPILDKNPYTNTYDQFGMNASGRLIKVPLSSVSAYQSATGWSDYASYIVGYRNTDEIDFTTLGLADTQVVDVDTYGPFSSGDMEVQFTTANPTYVSKYYTNGTSVRVYRQNSVVISSSKTISQIEFTWTGSDNYIPSSDVATPSGYDYQAYIWTGSANQVTLTRPNSSGHWKLKSILVTYQ